MKSVVNINAHFLKICVGLIYLKNRFKEVTPQEDCLTKIATYSPVRFKLGETHLLPVELLVDESVSQ